MSAAWLACIPTVVLVSVASSPAAQLPWMNASLPVDARVELLLGAMSNQEKTAQLNYGTIDTMSCTRSIFIPFSLTPYNYARPYREWNTVEAYGCLQHADDTVLRCYCNPSLDSGTRLFPSSSTNASIIIEQAAFSGGVGGIGCELPAAECPAFLAAVQAGLKKELRVRASPV